MCLGGKKRIKCVVQCTVENDVAGRRSGEALLLFFDVVNSFGKSRGLLAAVTLLFIPALKRRCREKIDRIRGPSTLIHITYGRRPFSQSPCVGYPGLSKYLVNVPSTYAKDSLKAYNSPDGYKCMCLIAGWVGTLSCLAQSKEETTTVNKIRLQTSGTRGVFLPTLSILG